MSDTPYWESEQDLTDAEQERIKVNEDFESQQPDGAAESIPAARDIEFNDELEQTIAERAEAIQTIDNDPDIPDKYEDDVYTSEARAERALKASALRGMGAATSTKGVESPVLTVLAKSSTRAIPHLTGDSTPFVEVAAPMPRRADAFSARPARASLV